MKNALFIFIALVIGAFLPQLEAYSFLIRYNLMGMLFFSFMKLEVSEQVFSIKHFWLVIANIGLGVLAYLVFSPLGIVAAHAAMLMALTPTGIASIIFADLLKSNIGFATTSVVLSNIVAVIVYPVALLLTLDTEVSINFGAILFSVFIIIIIPLVGSQLVVRTLPKLARTFRKLGWLPLGLFLVNILLASAKASHFIRFESDASWVSILQIVGITAVVCVVSFQLGGWIAGRKLKMEGSLGLGRKNTMLAIWLATTYLLPLTIIAPMSYIVIQNIYNAVQLARQKE